MTNIDRRSLLLAGAGVGAVGGAGPGYAASARAGDLNKPLNNVNAYLKLRASVETQDVYFWFAGGLDMAVPDRPIVPIVETETLILRRTQRMGTAEWHVTDWEATIYRNPKNGKLAKTIVNPVTGDRVKPQPYLEGPVRFSFTDREPRLLGIDDVLPDTGAPFFYPWRIVDGSLWMTKSTYIHIPHWLKPAEFPLASSGDNLSVSSISTLEGDLAAVLAEDVPAVRSRFSYQATTSWLPWMRMGQRPGFVIWHSAGKKLFALQEAPAATLKILRKVHPKWFQRPEPWPEFTNMFMRYREDSGAAG